MTEQEFKQTIATLQDIVNDLCEDLLAEMSPKEDDIAGLNVWDFDRIGEQLSEVRMVYKVRK